MFVSSEDISNLKSRPVSSFCPAYKFSSEIKCAYVQSKVGSYMFVSSKDINILKSRPVSHQFLPYIQVL